MANSAVSVALRLDRLLYGLLLVHVSPDPTQRQRGMHRIAFKGISNLSGSEEAFAQVHADLHIEPPQ